MSGRPQPALESLTGPLALATPSARYAVAAVSSHSPEERPKTAEERTTKHVRPTNDQEPHLVSGDCSLPLPQLETCQQVQAVLWLDPEDQVLADAEDVYDSDEDISDSSSLAGARLCILGGHGIGPCSCGGSDNGGSGRGSGSDVRMADTTCGSAPDPPPSRDPVAAHLSSVGPDTVQPPSALLCATSLPVVNSAVTSYTSPYPGYSSGSPSNQTRNCLAIAEAGQARDYTRSGGSGSSTAADCGGGGGGGGGGGNSSSACGVSRVTPEGHAGTACCCASVLKQCEPDQDQLPSKRRCLDCGTAAPQSTIPLPVLHDGDSTEYRYACHKAPPIAREELLQKQLPASLSSELERPVGQGQTTNSQDRHRNGMVLACETSKAGTGQLAGQSSIRPRLWPEQGRLQPVTQPPPTRSADSGVVPPSLELADQLARQPFSRAYIDPTRSTCNSCMATSYQRMSARGCTNLHPYVPAFLEHAGAHHVQNSFSSRFGGNGGIATAPASAPASKVQQMPPAYFRQSCSPHSGAGTGCGGPLSARSCGMTVIPSTVCRDKLGALTRERPAPSRASSHRLEDSTTRVGAPATGHVPSAPVALAIPYARAMSPSISGGPNDCWSGASPETPESLACRCSLCTPVAPIAIEPRPLSNQRPSAPYTPYAIHGVQLAQPSIDPNRSYGSTGAHTTPCPSTCLPSPHAPGQFTGPVGQLPHYIAPYSRQMAHQPSRLFRRAASPGGPFHACQSPFEYAPCGQRSMNSTNGPPGTGHGHPHHLTCSIKRELSLPEMPSITSDGGADGGWKPSLQLRCEERSPSSGGAAAPQRQSSGVSSVAGAAVSRRLLHEPGPSSSSEATMGRGTAEVPSETQRHQNQLLPGPEPTEHQQHNMGRISSGSSANSDLALENVPEPALAVAAVGERPGTQPAPLQEAEREPPEAPAVAPSKGTAVAGNSQQPTQQLLQQLLLQRKPQQQYPRQHQGQVQRKPVSPQVRPQTDSSERPHTCSEPQSYTWHAAQDRATASTEMAPPPQRRDAHPGSGSAVSNARQAVVLPPQARPDCTTVPLLTPNSPPRRDLPHQCMRHCLLPCTPLPSSVPAASMAGVSNCRVAVAAGGCGAHLSAAAGFSPAADSGRPNRVSPTFQPTAAASVLVMPGPAATQMTAAPVMCRCPHCRTSVDRGGQASSWQTAPRQSDVMKAPPNAAQYTVKSLQHAGATTGAAGRAHWSG
ncbi:hypothetical protein Vretifemale_6311 [Volvox reticuliferus]|uniref:Uncharacterized protein n=2 Tax=Volvox reticuliferus TaxID=1737510 RepID=A0A8J4CDQ1_9CHLO|nr:hypothetical protein Vretifemale_6311 [Volvox reticuliferus]